jgi:tagatose-1,6-bisphosphate aldolase
MPLTDINEEEVLACARYGLMLAEQNEDDAIRTDLLKLVRAWLANELAKAASSVLAEISARP